MFLYRPEYYASADKREELAGKAELIVSKQRNGPTGVVELFFQKAYTRFDSVQRGPGGGAGRTAERGTELRSMTGPRDGFESPSSSGGRRARRWTRAFAWADRGSRSSSSAGEPVLRHALRPFLSEPRVVAVVVALAPDDAAEPPAWITDLDGRIRVVAGGETRTDSVRNALLALPDDVDIIAVHDAARPLVTRAMISRVHRHRG